MTEPLYGRGPGQVQWRSSTSAGDVEWKAVVVIIYPVSDGVVVSLRARMGRGGTYSERVLGTTRVDLGESPDVGDIGAVLLAASDALAHASDTA